MIDPYLQENRKVESQLHGLKKQKLLQQRVIPMLQTAETKDDKINNANEKTEGFLIKTYTGSQDKIIKLSELSKQKAQRIIQVNDMQKSEMGCLVNQEQSLLAFTRDFNKKYFARSIDGDLVLNYKGYHPLTII